MATISKRQPAPKRPTRRRSSAPWWLGLALLLFVFWKYIGGPGGFLPGSGAGPDKSEGPPRTAPVRSDSTARRVVTAQFTATPPPPTPKPERQARSASVKVAPQPGSDTAEVTLKLDQTGAPFKGPGKVEIRRQPGGERPAGGEARSYPVTGGMAKIPNLRRGEKLLVTVIADNQQSLGGEMVVEDGARVALTDEATIKGRAVFAEGSPAANQDLVARVYRTSQEPDAIDVRTQADGAFELKTGAGHDVLLELRPKGAENAMDVDPIVEHKDVLDAGTTWDLGPVTFQREVRVAEGSVVDESGTPVPNATVLVLPLDLPIRALTARADASGKFSVNGPPNVGPIEIFALTEDKASLTRGSVPKGSSDLKLALALAGSVRGRVVSPAPGLNPLMKIELRTELRNLYATTQVLSDGSFELPHVPAGRYSLVVVAPDKRAEALSGLEVKTGLPASDQRLQAVPVDTGLAKATLRTMDSSGAPVGGARVEVALGPSAVLRARTDPMGSVEVVVPRDGSAPLSVEADGYAPYHDSWDGKRAVTLSPAQPESGPATRGSK